MVMKQVAITFLLLIMVGCAATPPNTPSVNSGVDQVAMDTVGEKITQSLNEFKDLMAGFIYEDPVVCLGAPMLEGNAILNDLERANDMLLDGARQLQQIETNSPLWNMFLWSQKQVIRARFYMAELLVEQKCFQEANVIYRFLIRKYVGGFYAGVRERAAAGVAMTELELKQSSFQPV